MAWMLLSATNPTMQFITLIGKKITFYTSQWWSKMIVVLKCRIQSVQSKLVCVCHKRSSEWGSNFRHSTGISLTNVINIITVNILLCSSSPAAHTAWEIFYILHNLCNCLYKTNCIVSSLYWHEEKHVPIHGHIFVSLNPHWIIPAAALLSMGGDLLSVPQPVMSQQAFHVLTDDAKHHLTSLIAGMSRAYYVAKYM